MNTEFFFNSPLIRLFDRFTGEIVFNDVLFSFPSRPTSPIINHMSLTIKPRTVTAVRRSIFAFIIFSVKWESFQIVGRSGSGKTTIATLLLRLYDPQTGSITLDGTDLKILNPTWLRSHIGAVNQEPVLFSGTIRENILYGVNTGDEISEDDFQRVVREAHVDEFVKQLPKGLETTVGQRGMMLSGGQKQRVAIARALIRVIFWINPFNMPTFYNYFIQTESVYSYIGRSYLSSGCCL